MKSEPKQRIEALLFVAAKPMPLKTLAKHAEISPPETKKELEALQAGYRKAGSGLSLVFNDDSVELVTAPEVSEVVAEFLKDETTGELTRPSLETLTIIAYRGPVAKAEIELIRGVNCSLILRNLRMRGLIEEDVNDAGVEVYSVSLEFLKHMGVSHVKELPNYDHLNADERLADLLGSEEWFKADE